MLAYLPKHTPHVRILSCIRGSHAFVADLLRPWMPEGLKPSHSGHTLSAPSCMESSCASYRPRSLFAWPAHVGCTVSSHCVFVVLPEN